MAFGFDVDALSLKSPKTTLNWEFEKSTLISMFSKPERKYFSFYFATSKTMHLRKDVTFTKRSDAI